MRVYVRDLALRSRIPEVDTDVAVVDLADRRCLADFERDRPVEHAVGFYPHVRTDLAERARELGIEPVEKRIFFADPAAVLRAP